MVHVGKATETSLLMRSMRRKCQHLLQLALDGSFSKAVLHTSHS